nr:hypothetical protein [Sicyoidochytrium minutum DNA virus]
MARYFDILLGALVLIIIGILIAAVVLIVDRPEGVGLWLLILGIFLAIVIAALFLVATARFSYKRIQSRRRNNRNKSQI